jgi:hypothetical protein
LPSFQVKTPHSLGRDAAKERLARFTDRVAEQYKDSVSRLESRWEQDDKLHFSITAYGFTFSGIVTVGEDLVVLDGNLPFAALPFRGRIESSFATELEKALR